MTRFAAIDTAGAVLGFYSDEAHQAPVPDGAVALTDEDWQRWASDPQAFRWRDGALTPFTPDAATQLTQLRATRAASLRATCSAAIAGGFNSNALGAPHHYSSTLTDQLNLLHAVAAAQTAPDGWNVPIWCIDGSGNASFVTHDAGQVRQVQQDAHTVIAGARSALATRLAAVASAASPEALNAITWAVP
jgi:hypothetical protein